MCEIDGAIATAFALGHIYPHVAGVMARRAWINFRTQLERGKRFGSLRRLTGADSEVRELTGMARDLKSWAGLRGEGRVDSGGVRYGRGVALTGAGGGEGDGIGAGRRCGDELVGAAGCGGAGENR